MQSPQTTDAQLFAYQNNNNVAAENFTRCHFVATFGNRIVTQLPHQRLLWKVEALADRVFHERSFPAFTICQ